MENGMERTAQNRLIALFSFVIFNQSEERTKNVEIFNEKKENHYDCHSIIKS